MSSVKTFLCILSVILALPLVSSCGKRGPLSIPAPHAPDEIKEMSLRQIGNRVHIKFTIPAKFKDTEPLAEEEVKQIMIYCTNEQYRDGKFRKKAEVVFKASPDQLKKLAPYKYETSVNFKNSFIDNRILSFSVRYKVKRKKSGFGVIRKLETMAPPSQIRDLNAEKRGKLVILKWDAPVISSAGEALTNKLKYSVYKFVVPALGEATPEDIKIPEFPEGFVKLGETTSNYYEDITGQDGQYIYCVTSITGKTESAPSVYRSLAVKDEFPPDPPAKLLSMSAAGHIYLTWKRSSDEDFAYYNVYRKKEGEEELELIAEKVKTTYYKDTKVSKGSRYSYAVTAVDSSDNESEISVIVTEEYI